MHTTAHAKPPSRQMTPLPSSTLSQITLAITAALMLACSSIAHARDYLIEVVVFENAANRELTAGGLYYPRIENSVRLGTDNAMAMGFLEVEQGLKLIEDASEIAGARRYQVLRHLAWRQPGLPDDEAVAIRVALGSSIPMYIPDNLRPYPEFFPGAADPTSERTEAINTYTINGTIKIRLGRFLHMDSRLVYTDQRTNQSFRLSKSRKMRSGELHYIDNPRFGLLTTITPLEDTAGTNTVDESANNELIAPE